MIWPRIFLHTASPSIAILTAGDEVAKRIFLLAEKERNIPASRIIIFDSYTISIIIIYSTYIDCQ